MTKKETLFLDDVQRVIIFALYESMIGECGETVKEKMSFEQDAIDCFLGKVNLRHDHLEFITINKLNPRVQKVMAHIRIAMDSHLTPVSTVDRATEPPEYTVSVVCPECKKVGRMHVNSPASET